MIVEDTYEVFDTNGTYHNSPVSDICIDPPSFPSAFLSTECSLASPHSFLDSNTCIIVPHISLSMAMPRTVYYLTDIVVKTQTLLFASP